MLSRGKMNRMRELREVADGHRPNERLAADRRYLSALIAGVDPRDERCANPGMAEVHEHNVRLALNYRSGQGS